MIADVTPEGEARTKGYTWMQTISGFFGVLAYVIGAVAGNVVLIYLGVAVVFLFSVMPILFVTEQREMRPCRRGRGRQGPRGKATQWGRALPHLCRACALLDRRPDDVRLHHRLHPDQDAAAGADPVGRPDA